MEFQLKYYKKDEDFERIEKMQFINEKALKRWYKKQFDNGLVKFSHISGWNYTLKKPFTYKIRYKP